MRVYGKSDVGKARDNNQDFYIISPPDTRIKIYVVADGMGGAKGGEIASKLAALSAKSYIETHFDEYRADRNKLKTLISNAIEYANMIVYEESKKDKSLKGMGTTIDICLIYNNQVFIGHVGDSRVYRIRKEAIKKLTTDHSLVQKLIDDGEISKEEAKSHPQKNQILKAVGCDAYVEPDVQINGFIESDILLMCSDGLTNMVSDTTIYDVIRENNIINEEKIVNKLIDLANDNGGMDNTTIVLIAK